jgi:hypothetical protein
MSVRRRRQRRSAHRLTLATTAISARSERLGRRVDLRGGIRAALRELDPDLLEVLSDVRLARGPCVRRGDAPHPGVAHATVGQPGALPQRDAALPSCAAAVTPPAMPGCGYE